MSWDRANYGRDDLDREDREAFWNGEWLGDVQPSLEDVGAGEGSLGEGGTTPAPTSEAADRKAVADMQRTVRAQAMKLALEGVRVP